MPEIDSFARINKQNVENDMGTLKKAQNVPICFTYFGWKLSKNVDK